MTLSQKSYIAGIVDGEGNIAIGKRTPKGCINPSYTGYVKVTNTDKRLLVWLKNVVGMGSIYSPNVKGNRRPIHNWSICDQEAEQFLREIHEFLVIKQEQARTYFDFRKTFGRVYPQGTPQNLLQTRKELFEQMQQLHHL